MNIYTDVLIVGTGVSGLYAALNLDHNIKITIITKSKIKISNSYLAQGGIATAKNDMDIPLFAQDTLKAGRYKSDVAAVNVLVNESIENINNIIDLGVELDYINGELSYTKEAAHSINRIVHSKDETGKAVIEALSTEVLKRKNITIYEDTYMVNLISQNNVALGVTSLKGDKQLNIYSKIVILATGGIGGIFKNSTNRRLLTADGIYVAIKNNIKLKNLEYIQFHPTAFYENTMDKRRFLISESLRGEGGKLLNSLGERFVDEMLPRDVVTDAILEEMKKTDMPNVYLDITFLPKDYIRNRFPGIYGECLKAGIDITKDLIPVSPAQHYFMGGIDVNLDSKTSMDHLYAVGELTCTGVHGANRLASNSLLEGLVFSRRAAKAITNEISNIKITEIAPPKIRDDIKTIQKRHLDTVIEVFKGKVGKFINELVDNR